MTIYDAKGYKARIASGISCFSDRLFISPFFFPSILLRFHPVSILWRWRHLPAMSIANRFLSSPISLSSLPSFKLQNDNALRQTFRISLKPILARYLCDLQCEKTNILSSLNKKKCREVNYPEVKFSESEIERKKPLAVSKLFFFLITKLPCRLLLQVLRQQKNNIPDQSEMKTCAIQKLNTELVTKTSVKSD